MHATWTSKMADTASVARSTSVFKRSRLKPEIYQTVDGKVVVEDELLNFLSVKMKTMSHDEIVILATNAFDSEWIESSKKALFELCSTTQRNVSHKGAQKDANNIKSCLKVLNECGENVPRFVSYYLDDLPPVTFNSLDVSCLLTRMEQLSAEVATLKDTVKIQAEVGNDLRMATESICDRLGALERRPATEWAKDANVDVAAAVAETHANADSNERGLDISETMALPSLNNGINQRKTAPEWSLSGPQSPKWTQVVKKSRRATTEDTAAEPRNLAPGQVKRARLTKPIVGTGTMGNIRTVKTKLVSVFASRFSPELDEATLALYLKEKLGRDVTCNKLDTVHNRFSSFKVCAECNDVKEMYDPDVWPEGALVRRFYEPRRVGNTRAVPGARDGLARVMALRNGTTTVAN